MKAVLNRNVDIIAHPTGRLIGRREEIDVDWDVVFKACVKNKVALEINSAIERLDLNDKLAMQAKENGVKMVISTDAHSTKGLKNIQNGIIQARRAWLTKDDILNTLGKEKLLLFFRK